MYNNDFDIRKYIFVFVKITDDHYNQAPNFLPCSVKEMKQLGWDQPDVILFTGDAYVDHPAFGAAIVARLMESMGLKVAVVPQPNWRDDLRDFRKMGQPRLFFAVTSGNMDSMVNHYTANKRLRSDDAYTPGGISGFRPDYAVNVYCQIIKKLYPGTPVVIGGIEASMRRLSHYDYWADEIIPSVLITSGADLLLFGMAEKAIVQLVARLLKGEKINQIHDIPQTGFLLENESLLQREGKNHQLFPFEDSRKDKAKYASNFRIFEQLSNQYEAESIIEPYRQGFVVINQAFPPLSTKELDAIYTLPFTRKPHPRYKDKIIPAFEMIKNSVTIHRGCFGGCSFCAISAHQGKFVISRSEASVLNELKQITRDKSFNGTITDLGGPSANMYRMQGTNLEICRQCKRPSCIFPATCPNLNTDIKPLTALYEKALKIKGINHIFIGSGIRYDLLFGQNGKICHDGEVFLTKLILLHTSGRLKVAPEHTSDKVLQLMRKPGFKYFAELKKVFDQIVEKNKIPSQLIPYFISSHPACTVADMAELALKTRQMGYKLEQIQDFTPTPMTLSTTMYYTGTDPYSGKKIHVAASQEEKKAQRSLFFWYKKELKNEIIQILRKWNATSYIGRLYGR